MKPFVYKLILSFVFTYALLMGTLVFAYNQISANFVRDQAMDSLERIHLGVTTRLNSQLAFDHARFSQYIYEFEQAGLDPVEELNALLDDLFVGTVRFGGFARLDDAGLVQDGTTYAYTTFLNRQDFEQTISVYVFSAAFNGHPDLTAYVVFRADDYIAFVEADAYLETIFEIDEQMAPHYFILSSDNYVFFQNHPDADQRFFYDYLRDEGQSEVFIDGIKDIMLSRSGGVVESKLFGAMSYLVFKPMSDGFSARELYLVGMYEEEIVIASFAYLNTILIAIFFVVFVIFAVSLLILYKVIEAKNNDIENARLTLYYAKPFILKISGRGVIRSYNKSFKRLLGDFRNYRTVSDFQIKEKLSDQTIQEVIRRQKAFTAIFQLAAESVYIHFIPIRSSRGYLLIGDDVTSVEGRFDEYKGLAMHNVNTNLPNYNQLKQDLREMFADPYRLNQKNALVVFDIVAFSKLELLLGERNIGKVLGMAAEVTHDSLDGYPAKLYNTELDNFTILFEDLEDANWVKRWIDKVLIAFDQPLAVERNIIYIEIKIGVFHIDAEKYSLLTPDQAYENAMLALNHAKQSNVHTFFDYDVNLGQVASREQMMEQDLANAINKNEFYMVFQPQYDNELEKITGFEALIRWNNPKYANESPFKFIQMAEQNNMIIDIGRIVLHETFMAAKELEPYGINISINVSPVQILQAGFVNEVISVFEQYELKKGSISLEITESFLITSFDLVIEKLRLLRKYGFEVHLDDFGTGYSSLQYLRDLPITAIKIDRAFIKNIDNDTHSRAIVSMVSSLAKSVGLEVIGEGVENNRQNHFVVRGGCNIIQGYLISPPVVKDEAIKLIEAFNIDKTRTIERVMRIREVKR